MKATPACFQAGRASVKLMNTSSIVWSSDHVSHGLVSRVRVVANPWRVGHPLEDRCTSGVADGGGVRGLGDKGWSGLMFSNLFCPHGSVGMMVLMHFHCSTLVLPLRIAGSIYPPL